MENQTKQHNDASQQGNKPNAPESKQTQGGDQNLNKKGDEVTQSGQNQKMSGSQNPEKSPRVDPSKEQDHAKRE